MTAEFNPVLGLPLEVHELGPLRMAWFPMKEGVVGAAGSLVQGALRRAAGRGGKVLNPKMSIGEYGFVGHFEDSEGNRVAVHSRA